MLNVQSRLRGCRALLVLAFALCLSTSAPAQDIAKPWTPETSVVNADVKVLAESDGRVFAGTYSSGLFYSDDAGASWMAAGNGFALRQITAILVHNNHIFVAGAGGLYRSADNGDSWQEIQSTPVGSFTRVSSMTQHGSSIVVATSTNFFFSADNGDSWNAVPMSPIPKSGVHFLQSENDELFFASGGELYTYNPFVQSIQAVDSPTLELISFIKVVQGQIYVGGSATSNLAKLQIFYAADRTWQAVSANLPPSANVLDLVQRGDKQYCATTEGVFERMNGGEWSRIPTSSEPQAFQSLTTVDNYLISGTATRSTFRYQLDLTDGPFEQSAAGLTGWTPYRIWNTSDFIFAHSNGTGTLYKARDGAADWANVEAGTPEPLLNTTDILPFKDELLMASRLLYHSTDNGRTWSLRPDGNTQDVVNELAVTEDDIFAFNREGIIRYTSDGELERYSLPVAVGFHDVLAHNEILYGSTFDGRILRSLDYAKTWQDFGSGLTSRPLGHLFATADYMIGATSIGVFVSTDAGNNWKNISVGQTFENTPVLGIAESQGFLYIVTRAGMWFTADLGDSWNTVSRDGIPGYVNFNSISIYEDEIFVGSYGDGIFRTTLQPAVTDLAEVVGSTADFNITPNPAAQSTQFSLNLTHSAFVELTIFDMLGNSVLQPAGGFQSAGLLTQDLDLTTLASGQYILFIRAAETTYSQQFTVIR